MTLLEPVERYFDAWNSHDGDAIAACFDPDGAYTDPVSGRLVPPGIAAYASGLFNAFPDLRFELDVTAIDGSCVVAQWTMSGRQSGPLNGLPPTEASIKLPGIDVITVGDKGLLSVEGYFDQRTLIEQLGAQVAVQPTSVGPLAFGTSVRFRSSNTSVPGALAMTWIEVRSEAEAEDVRQRSRAIVAEMARVPGFLGWVGIVIAERLYTAHALGRSGNLSGSSEPMLSTRPRYDRCSRRTSALPGIPESGCLITSIRRVSGVRSAEPSSTQIVPNSPARAANRPRHGAPISRPTCQRLSWL